MKKSNNFFGLRKVKYGTAATAIIVLVIAAVVILNMIMGTLSDKVMTSVDLTKNKVFNLSEDSKKFLTDLKEDVEIVVLNSEREFESLNDYTMQASRIIKQYAKNSSKIKVSYVDVVKDPTYLSTYSKEQVSRNSLIIKTDKKYKIVSIRDIISVKQDPYDGSETVSSNAENEITSAIIYVTSGVQTKIALIRGYGESDTSGIVKLLESNNFQVEEVPILTGEIPSDAKAVIVFAPERDYDERGIEKINKYMDNQGNHGKNLFLVLNEANATYTNINKLIDPYGIKVGDGVVFDTDPNFLAAPMPFYTLSSIVTGEYSQKLKDSQIPIYSPASVKIENLDQENVKSLTQTSTKAGVRPFNADKDWKITKDSIVGQLDTGLVSSKNDSRVFVFGSREAFSSEVVSQSSVNNAAYFVNLFKTFNPESSVDINIEPVSLESPKLGINVSQKINFFWLFVIIIPAIVIAIGIFVIVMRKKKSRLL